MKAGRGLRVSFTAGIVGVACSGFMQAASGGSCQGKLRVKHQWGMSKAALPCAISLYVGHGLPDAPSWGWMRAATS